ncbi:MAG: hypothetical protein WC942_11735 [Clostridia bacterium]|jgi:predicted DNA-binding transcriptional regulator YafY
MFDIVMESGRDNKLCEIQYTKTNGESKSYTLEPYSVRGDYFFGYDVNEGTIKKFLIANITYAQKTDESFSPRWNVEF